MLRGDYAVEHRADILNLVHNEEKAEKAEHPLHRIMNVGEWPRTICIRTTDIHLPHRIGEAIHRAHKGNLHVHYNAESLLVRVNWSRDK
jgi:hypothetical protein